MAHKEQSRLIAVKGGKLAHTSVATVTLFTGVSQGVTNVEIIGRPNIISVLLALL